MRSARVLGRPESPIPSIRSSSFEGSWGGPTSSVGHAVASCRSAAAAATRARRRLAVACAVVTGMWCSRTQRKTACSTTRGRSRYVRLAALRLRALHALNDPLGHKAAARETLPQRHKPYLARMPRFRLKPMPFKTFGELPALGLALSVYCPACYTTNPVEIIERLASHRWGRVRLTCSRTHYNGYLCGSRGHLRLEPVEPMSPDEAFVSMECCGCAAPWFATQVQLGRLPWSLALIDAGKERYRCPGCGGQVRATFHGKLGEGGRIAGHLLNPTAQGGPSFT